MSTTNATDIKNRATEYSYHREPAAQGGLKYAACLDCGREVIAGCEANLTHRSDCKFREVR